MRWNSVSAWDQREGRTGLVGFAKLFLMSKSANWVFVWLRAINTKGNGDAMLTIIAIMTRKRMTRTHHSLFLFRFFMMQGEGIYFFVGEGGKCFFVFFFPSITCMQTNLYFDTVASLFNHFCLQISIDKDGFF